MWNFVLPAIATVAGAAIGSQEASKERDAANRARAEALAQYAGISIPEAEKMMLNLQQYETVGEYSPEMQQALSMGPSAMEGISLDPAVRARQMQALEQMAGFATGGPTSAESAGFELARQNAAAEAQAKSAQLMQEMAQRGQAGGGAELIARLKSGQSGAQMLQQAQLQQAQAMQQARLQALQDQSTMAGNLRTQDYSEQARLAEARDVINRMNLQNQQQIAASNIAARNQAQMGNLAQRQKTAEQNVALLNQQQQYNKALQQQEFENKMRLAAGKAGQYGQQAESAQQRAGQTAAQWGTIGQGLGSIFGGIAQNMNQPKYDASTGQKIKKFDPMTGEAVE